MASLRGPLSAIKGRNAGLNHEQSPEGVQVHIILPVPNRASVTSGIVHVLRSCRTEDGADFIHCPLYERCRLFPTISRHCVDGRLVEIFIDFPYLPNLVSSIGAQRMEVTKEKKRLTSITFVPPAKAGNSTLPQIPSFGGSSQSPMSCITVALARAIRANALLIFS